MRQRSPTFTLGLILALVGARVARADSQTFNAGSLIIPMQSSFQTPCGVFSAYGLVYRMLMENQSGGYFTTGGRHKITVYEVISPTKGSPNRCVPTNLHSPPDADARWNDGCDFSITGSGGIPPVVPVPDGAPAPPAGITYPASVIRIYSPSSDMASPAYPAPAGYSSASSLTKISYLGGPFLIKETDAPEVLDWLHNKASDPTLAWFTNHDNTLETQCNDYNTITSFGAYPNYQVTWNYHFVQMHQATISFTAPVERRLTSKPPKIALLKTGSPGTGGAVESYLDAYLHESGLYFSGVPGITDSGGCPPDSNDTTCTLNGGQPGLIYDQFSANLDLISMKHGAKSYKYGLLNATDASGEPIYPVLWSPHWDVGDSTYSTSVDANGNIEYVPNGDGAPDQKTNAVNNILYFASQKNRGVMSECASIYTLQNRTSAPPRFLVNGPIVKNTAGVYLRDAQNCSDPSYSSGDCASYPNPASPFAQIGDFHLHTTIGAVTNYKPGGTYSLQPFTQPLITSIDLVGDQAEYADFGYYQGDNQKGAIIYLSGHDYSGDSAYEPAPNDLGSGGDPGKILQVAGVRVVLNTLLNLGYAPVTSERAVSAPVGYVDPNQANTAFVYSGTYNAVINAPDGAETYSDGSHDGSGGKGWMFPFISGTLRAHPLTGANALAAGESDFSDAALWNADGEMPKPHDRNLFTYLGGQFATLTSAAIPGTGFTVTGTRPLANGVLQGGWLPEAIEGTHLAPCSAMAPGACLNVVKFGTGPGGSALVPGQDGFCDLEQVLNFSNLNSGADWGGACHAHNADELDNDLRSVQELLQRIRGYCYAHDAAGTLILEPNDWQCDPADLQKDNRAHLGGIVNSTPAIVPPSPNVAEATPRPTVAYVGGLDGQLHALYISGGSGYTGPSSPLHLPNPPANFAPAARAAVFKNDYLPVNWNYTTMSATVASGSFSPPDPGTELWSFMPASQLQQASTNNAKVDSSPVVQDVFADFTGTGVREWHTVLIVSLGASYNEVVALDVTNPLQPALLWDIEGSFIPAGSGYHYSAIPTSDANSGGTASPYKWDQETSNFVLGNATPATGRTQTLPYDFSDLGGSTGVAVGQLRAGFEPQYLAFVTSSEPTGSGLKGAEIFAIDIPTGQKVWQWRERYGVAPFSLAATDNTPPPVASLYQTADGVQRLLAGDMQGRLWELNAATGQNWNMVPGAGGPPYSLPAFDDGSGAGNTEPISTNIAMAKVPATTPAGSLFHGFENATVLLFGTAGETWVSDSTPGKFYALLFDTKYRVPYVTGGTHLDASPWPQPAAFAFASAHAVGSEHGVLQMPLNFPLVFPPDGSGIAERLFGNIVVSGQDAFFQTSKGALPSDINTLGTGLAGASYMFNLGSATPGLPPTVGGSLGRFGAVALVHGADGKDYVVSDEVGKISNTVIASPGSAGSAKNTALNPSGTANGPISRLVGWIVRLFT